MTIRFLRAWRRATPGQVVEDYHTGAARVLIKRGIAEEVVPKTRRKRANI